MSYKVYIYAFMLFASTFAISGINFENIIRKNKIWEVRILVALLIGALTYLTSNFIISFIEL